MIRALVFLAVMTVPVAAQQVPCFPADIFAAGLEKQFGEVPLWEGLLSMTGDAAPVPVIMYAAPRGRTWTIVRNVSPKVVCPFASGTDFDVPQLPRSPKGDLS